MGMLPVFASDENDTRVIGMSLITIQMDENDENDDEGVVSDGVRSRGHHNAVSVGDVNAGHTLADTDTGTGASSAAQDKYNRLKKMYDRVTCVTKADGRSLSRIDVDSDDSGDSL